MLFPNFATSECSWAPAVVVPFSAPKTVYLNMKISGFWARMLCPTYFQNYAEHPHETWGHEHLRQAAKAWAMQFWESNFQALLFIVTYHCCERNLQFINLLYFVFLRLEWNWNKTQQFLKRLGHLPDILFMSKTGFCFFVEQHRDLLVNGLSHSLKIIMQMLY